ncbi:porin [Crenobacter caeni]|uniref:Porin n=1 Tax=Crenobacter caeni TaxID=2705474 RepID=A0A6B2KTK7_9NEIS|nr:porin [Crenobacter caeni]NDV13329.1 porin [Crenobacter caeni]
MNKKIIALAVAMLPAAAMADVVIYGEAGAALEGTKTTTAYGSSGTDGTVTKVENYNSKIGFKGSEDLGNGLKAVWQVEQKIGIDGTGGNTWATRDSFVGLSGDFGTVQLGRLSTFQNIYSNIDPWKYEAGWNGLAWDANVLESGIVPDVAAFNLGGVANYQSRMNNAIAYTTPEWSGFSARAMYSAASEKKVEGSNPYAWEIGLRYAFDAFYAQYSYTASKEASLLGAGSVEFYDGVEASFADSKSRMNYFEVGYDANGLSAAIAYVDTKLQQDGDAFEFLGETKTKQLGLNVAYTMGQFVPRFQYAHGWEVKVDGDKVDGSDYNQYVLGLDYLLSKRTKAHVSAAYIKSGDAPNENGLDGKTWLKGNTYSVGLTHLF